MIRNTVKKLRLDWLFGGNPDAILQQEKEGQEQLVETSFDEIQQLPAKGNGCDASEIYKKLGLEVIGPSEGDEMFLDVRMKKGWHVEATGHSMWTDLVDANGNKRASIFYKAAFYDRSSFINPLVHRYRFQVGHEGHLKKDYSQDENGNYNHLKTPIAAFVFNANEVMHKTDPIEITQHVFIEGERGYTDEYKKQREKAFEVSCRRAVLFLNSQRPEWQDPMAYWD